MCGKRAREIEEDQRNRFYLHFDFRPLKRYKKKNSYRFYIFSCAIYVRNMDVINQVALHINNNNIESLRKQNLELKQQYCLSSLRQNPSHCKFDIDDLGTAMIPGLAEEEQYLSAAR